MTLSPTPIICLVTDRRRLTPAARTFNDECHALLAQVERAVDARIDFVQIRERDLSPRDLAGLTRSAVAAACGSGTRILVNDRADVALAAGADGVHLRADGPDVSRTRALGLTVIGRSAHSAEELARAIGVDFVIFGTVFPSISKAGAPGQGLRSLRAAARSTAAPVLAIGGVTAVRAADCRRAGAAGIAAIGLFLQSPHDAAMAVREAFAG